MHQTFAFDSGLSEKQAMREKLCPSNRCVFLGVQIRRSFHYSNDSDAADNDDSF